MITTIQQALDRHQAQMKLILSVALKNNDRAHFEYWADAETKSAISDIPVHANLADFSNQVRFITEEYRKQIKLI